MFEIETQKYSKANLKRWAFYLAELQKGDDEK